MSEINMLKEELKIGFPETNSLDSGPGKEAMKKYEDDAKEIGKKSEEIQKNAAEEIIPKGVKKRIVKTVLTVLRGGAVLVSPFIFNACKEGPTEISESVEGKADFEEPLIEEEQKEETPAKTEETQTEFNENMIKNRLIFPEHVAYLEPWMKAGESVPLWYVQDWSGGKGQEIMASGIVAGPLRKGIGVTGEEELLLSVAFQNPETKEFYIRDLSFGTNEVLQIAQNRGGWPTIFLENNIYTGGGGSYTMTTKGLKEIEANLKIGDQIVFSLVNKWDSNAPTAPDEIKNSYEYKVIREFMSMYFENNETIYEAMKENGELPELILNPWIIVINKAEENQ